MAIIKVYFRKNAKSLIEYVEREAKPEDPSSAVGCNPETAASDFESTKRSWGSKGVNEAMHVIQSWSEDESKKHSPEFFHELGKKLSETYFKGHEVVIRTHTDTGKTHNHIVANMVNFETGKMLENKKHHLYRLRELSDKICLENGLSVINREGQERRARLPDKVLRMERFKRRSYLLDTMQKADFARKYATSYDEYVAILGQLGIGARVEEKNITYFYPGQSRGKRGSKLGRSYDKGALEEAFKTNDELFASRPELRSDLKSGISAIQSGVANNLSSKDYSKYTKTQRGHERVPYPFEKELHGSVVPIEELRKARMGNILEYCKRNKIALALNDKGETVVKGRPFVVVSSNEWMNAKNRTRGTLIEFVAMHKDMSFLQAVAHINNNPRLLLLEQHFGEQKRKYTSFHIPAHEAMEWKSAVAHLTNFLEASGCKSKGASALLRGQHVQVSKSGAIRFLSADGSGGALEFTPEKDGTWTKRSMGSSFSPFFSSKGKSKRLLVYSDPISLIDQHGDDLFGHKKRDVGVLGLFELDGKAVDTYVAQNQHVKELVFVTPRSRKRSTGELDLFGILKAKYHAFGIDVREAEAGPDLQREGPTLTR